MEYNSGSNQLVSKVDERVGRVDIQDTLIKGDLNLWQNNMVHGERCGLYSPSVLEL